MIYLFRHDLIQQFKIRLFRMLSGNEQLFRMVTINSVYSLNEFSSFAVEYSRHAISIVVLIPDVRYGYYGSFKNAKYNGGTVLLLTFENTHTWKNEVFEHHPLIHGKSSVNCCT